MRFTSIAARLLRRWEKLELKAYLCPRGRWTIGYGHTGPDVHPGLVWTREQAEAALVADVARHASGVSQYVTVPLNDNQYSALVMFAFNVGVEAFAGSALVHLLNEGRYHAVPEQLARWNKIHDPDTHQVVELEGLTRRRAAEISVWRTPADTSPTLEVA